MTPDTVPLGSGLVTQIVKHSAPVGPDPLDGRVRFGCLGEEMLTNAYEPFADEPPTSIL